VWQGPLSKIVIAGHSPGCLTALLVNQSDPHVKGAILLDPVPPEVLPGRANKPILILGADRKRGVDPVCLPTERSHVDRFQGDRANG
jgi:predicted esterase